MKTVFRATGALVLVLLIAGQQSSAQLQQSFTLPDGADITLGAKADNKSTATDATPISVVSILKQVSASIQAAATSLTAIAASLVTATTANSKVYILSTGTAADETQIKGTTGVLAGYSCTNSHATTTAYLKFTNLTAASTTPQTSAVWGSAAIPPGPNGIVDRNIEDTFSVALTAYIVTEKADTGGPTGVAAGDVRCNISYR